MSKKSKGNLDKRLKAYTAAAAGVLVAAPAAHGAVNYSGLKNQTVSVGNPVFVDLNNDGQDDFRFWVNTGWYTSYPSGLAWLNIDSVGVGSHSGQETYGLSGTGVIHNPFNVFHLGAANLPSCYQVERSLSGANYWGPTSYYNTGGTGGFETLANTSFGSPNPSEGNFNGGAGLSVSDSMQPAGRPMGGFNSRAATTPCPER